MKNVIAAAMKGIRIAATVFLVICMIMGFIGGNEKFTTGINMAYMCIAVIMIGIGFGVPSLIYETELPTALKILIHMGVGITVMLAASVFAGWIDFSKGWKACLLIIGIEIGAAVIIWLLSCVSARRLTDRMNRQLKTKE